MRLHIRTLSVLIFFLIAVTLLPFGSEYKRQIFLPNFELKSPSESLSLVATPPKQNLSSELVNTPSRKFPLIFQQDNPQTIPALIVRTWKNNDKRHLAADPRWTQWFSTWTQKNPGHLHILLDDEEGRHFVAKRFPGKIAQAYFRLPLVVQRADFLRYLLLWYFGGVYSDMDTSCLKPIDEWAPKDSQLIAGLEVGVWTQGFEGNNVQLTQWTMSVVPRHPAYTSLIETLTESILNSSNETLHNKDNVVRLTGPIPYTKAILKYLESQKVGSTKEIEDLVVGYKVFGDVTILGAASFSMAGADRADSYVRHEYTGEWGDGWKKSSNYAKEEHP
ncbi:membrane-bound alpha-1,6- mannosyltransferase Initiation-specific [Nowakowskiella sp. JEL0078]|nr:membrane-bound alpha-1,6- mannosyltransferase Initiation-specific [Nowakowskiella sp. JEL0078]